MTVEIVVCLLVLACFVAGWIFTHRTTPQINQADTKIIVLDFEAKKKAEAERIDAEKPSELLDDLNKR